MQSCRVPDPVSRPPHRALPKHAPRGNLHGLKLRLRLHLAAVCACALVCPRPPMELRGALAPAQDECSSTPGFPPSWLSWVLAPAYRRVPRLWRPSLVCRFLRVQELLCPVSSPLRGPYLVKPQTGVWVCGTNNQMCDPSLCNPGLLKPHHRQTKEGRGRRERRPVALEYELCKLQWSREIRSSSQACSWVPSEGF